MITEWKYYTIANYLQSILGNRKPQANGGEYINRVNRQLPIPNIGYGHSINRQLRGLEHAGFVIAHVIQYKANPQVSPPEKWMRENFVGKWRVFTRRRLILIETDDDLVLFKLAFSASP